MLLIEISFYSLQLLRNQQKIAEIERKLHMLDKKKTNDIIAPDIGGSSNPTKVIYNYIEDNKSSGSSKLHKNISHPYMKKKKHK